MKQSYCQHELSCGRLSQGHVYDTNPVIKALWKARHLPRDLAHRREIQRETIGLKHNKVENEEYILSFVL